MHSSALTGLRIGCVPYLNARPLVWGIEQRVHFEIPSLLADHFAAGLYDVALIPVFETLRMPESAIVDGACISCVGEVHSVILAHCEPLKDIQEIVLDPASRTSTNLLRIILAERLHISPQLVEQSEDPRAARLMIGDPAIAFRNKVVCQSAKFNWQILDLGKAWHEWLSLPFVFAVWTLQANIPSALAVANSLRATAKNGLTARSLIAAQEIIPAVALDYLTRHIRYSLGDQEKMAIAQFQKLLIKNNLLDSISTPPQFI